MDGKTGEELPLMRSPAALVVKDLNENEDAKTVEEVREKRFDFGQ